MAKKPFPFMPAAAKKVPAKKVPGKMPFPPKKK